MHKQIDVAGWSRFWLARFALVRLLADFWNSLAHRLAWPYVELIIRLWIAKLFFFFGIQQLMHWAAALQIVDEGNPFPLLAPVVSAYLSTGANLVCAILLAMVGSIALMIGAGTRYVALLLLLSLFVFSVADPRLSDSIYLLMLLAILVVHGGGVLAIDAFARRWQSRLFSVPNSGDLASRNWPRVVIVGASFGGLRCAQALKGAKAAVTLIDRNNFHLFQPLLYQVATAALSPGDIAMATRQIFRDAPATRLLLSTVTGIDTEKRLVLTERREIPYDYLVLATGATHSYFGKDEWARQAPGLKYVEDALEVRRRILTAFERAEESVNESEKAALLTFLIVGGGPTGVELAGAIAELARFGLNQDFRTFDPAKARIILVQAGARLLPTFPERLSAIAQRALENLGVEVRLESRVNAKQIRALIDARAPMPAFRYRHLGSLATIGRKAAVADFGAFNLWGAPAWWLWGVVHIGFMLGVRNRVSTLLNWFWSYLKFGGGIRLITGDKT